MDIPSIKFRYFEKLKLWHDYLSPNSIFETEKIEYWKHEKIILLWAYSDKHQHLYSSFGNNRIFAIYGLNRSRPEIKIDQEIVNDLRNNKGKINYIKGNLDIKGFAETTEINKKGYPEKIRITSKGLLLGEIIFESMSNNFFKKNFRYYKWGYVGLIILILSVSLILFATFFEEVLFPVFNYIKLMDFISFLIPRSSAAVGLVAVCYNGGIWKQSLRAIAVIKYDTI